MAMVFSNLLMQALEQEIAGQEYAVATLTRVVTLALGGMVRGNRPAAVLLFAGPTGSGKTHAAQALARILLGDERNGVYVDCEQFGEAEEPLVALHQQIAAGLARSMLLPSFVPSRFWLIVLEDIDKAPVVVRHQLANSIDRGEVCILGSFLSLSNCLIILTSTLSKKRTDQLVGRTIGFSREGEAALEMPNQRAPAIEEIDALVGAPLVSRIDEVIIFEHLREQNILTILERHLASTQGYLSQSGIGFAIDQEARIFLLRQGLGDLTHGTRQIRRAIRNHLEFPLADLMVSGRLSPGTAVVVTHQPPQSFLHFQVRFPYLRPQIPPEFAGDPSDLPPQMFVPRKLTIAP